MTLKTLAFALAFALSAAWPAAAQQVTPPYGPPITLDMAKKVMAGAEAEAAKNTWTVVITIVDSGGNPVMMHRIDNTQLASVAASAGKAQTAIAFKRPSKQLEDAVAAGGPGLRLIGLKDIWPIEGGLPIIVDGKVVGAIGVSGSLSSQDAQIARAGIEALGR